ncbi:MAG: hypothetical protein IH595_01175 [Bacteroidales bacterium]|nr:hypothetical protein [Bacteroidales bacterium]
MNGTVITILTGLLILVVGFFLRDIYNYLKRKFIKSQKPKVALEYIVRASGAHSSNPRIYEFKSWLFVQNIDIEPIYNLKIVQYSNNFSKEIFSKNHLSPNDKEEIRDVFEIPFEGEELSDYKSAIQSIPDDRKNPDFTLHFEDRNGHKYSQKALVK